MSQPSQLPVGRYGPEMTPARKRLTIIGIAVLAALGIGIAVWSGLGMAKTPVWTQDVGYSVISSERVDVTFDVTKDLDATVRCRVKAMNASKAEVGTTEVVIGPTDSRSTRHQVAVATSEQAATGIIHSCQIAE